ncbi:MAG TPA: META domain-containing protein, partial [Candidatus Limnocylindrales bacterium]|nr:META domain-containing protein [Candidatus Limnocylindrales bacterium]
MPESPLASPRLTSILAAGIVVAGLSVGAGAGAGAQSPSPGTATLAGSPVASSASPVASSASPAPAVARPDGTWMVLGFDAWGDGLVEPLRGSSLTVSLLPAGRLEGETGCGTYVGSYTVDGDRIRLGIVSKGGDACGRKPADEAFDLTQALTFATTWAPSASGLELLDDSGRVRVALARPAVDGLAGAWLVERYARSSGDLAGTLDGTEVSISFGPDGRVTGSTGCRTFEGSYSVEADRIVIAPIEVVGLPCEGDERRQDRRILGILDTSVLWRREGGWLILADGSGVELIEASTAAHPLASPAVVGSAEPVMPEPSGEPAASPS